MNVVFLGATRGMGRALARRMVQRGDRLFLLGRNAADLERSARDLEVHGAGRSVETAPCDLHDRTTFAGALDRAEQQLAGFDAVVVTAALFATQEQLEIDAGLRDELLRVNFANTVAFCEEARMRLLARGGGVLCVFSSVAGDRSGSIHARTMPRIGSAPSQRSAVSSPKMSATS